MSKVIVSKVTKLLAITFLCCNTINLATASDGTLFEPREVNTRFIHVLERPPRESKGFRTIFVPGGPGFDSSYLRKLVDTLDLPGSSWLCDLPGNGEYKPAGYPIFSFTKWRESFSRDIAAFKSRPGGPLVVVGHSFGGLLTLTCPELEGIVDHLILLNSLPRNLTDSVPELDFIRAGKIAEAARFKDEALNTKTEEAVDNYLLAFKDFFFADFEEGEREEVQRAQAIRCAWQPLYWFEAEMPLRDACLWAPNPARCPTLIVGGEKDVLCNAFESDARFNVLPKVVISGAGHFCWLKGGAELKIHVDRFLGISSS